ncbi:MAG: hypothetical protein ACRYFR_12490 [Janthinobacterium lividum]
MKILLYILLLLPLTKPSKPDKWLREFMRDAVEKKLDNTVLADKYFCTNILHRTDEYGEKARKGTEWALTMQRDLLRAQHVNADEVTFTPYDELPASKIPPKPFHMLGETKHVYVALYRGEIVSYFLLQDEKVASTLLIGQGDEHYFIDFCH